MFDLENKIREWKKDFCRQDSLDDGTLADMELLLRDAYAAKRRDGLREEDAFLAAGEQVGPADSVGSAYRRNRIAALNRRSPFRPARFMPGLLGNYVKVALRRIRREKGFAFINIAGLSLGLAACLLITGFVAHELSYDRFHKNADRIFRVTTDAKFGNNAVLAASAVVPLGPAMVRDFSEVAAAVRFHRYFRSSKGLVSFGERRFYETGILYSDSSVFSVFSFPLVQGDPRTALERPYTVVLTESLAVKYFGGGDPIGRILRIDLADYVVTGVMKDVPGNSHLKFSLLLSNATAFAENSWLSPDRWFPVESFTYVVLRDPRTGPDVETKLAVLAKDRYADQLKAVGGYMRFRLQPLVLIHLHSRLPFDIAVVSSAPVVMILLLVSLFILVIAVINFMNLATARAAKRSKEIGLRKVLGATRGDLVGQVLGESIIHSLTALAIALILAGLVLPLFKSISGIDPRLGAGQAPWLIPGLLGLALGVGLAAGSYPALILSAFRPARVLKSGPIVHSGGSRFRRVLVMAQFGISIAIIICTGVIRSQARYMKTADVGFAKTGVLVARIENPRTAPSPSVLRSRLKEIPGVLNVSFSSEVPGQRVANFNPVVPEGSADRDLTPLAILRTDADYVPALGLDIAKGRNFSNDVPADVKNAVLINEAAARKFGWSEPVGKTLKFLSPDPAQAGTRTVVGVIRDYNFKPLRESIEPLVIVNQPDNRTVAIRFQTKDLNAFVGSLRAAWKNFDPDYPLDYVFLDQFLDAQYRAEDLLSQILAASSILSLVIACLGLFGMASFMTAQRTKEIGIRKVLGAGAGQIVRLLSLEYLKLVGLAALLAWPVAYLAMKGWLRSFAFRTPLRPGTFLLAALAALLIALMSVGVHTVKAASADPVDSLKYE